MSTKQSDSSIKLIYRSITPSTPLALCRNGESIYLRSINLNNNNSDQSPIAAHLSVLVEQDPYPGFTMDGRQMIWLKDYGENTGLLEELEQARIVQSVGRTIKQGFVTFPLCIVLLNDKQILQTCTFCERVEGVNEVERFKRCGKCKRRFYCSPEHQTLDWPTHKPNCKDLQKLDFVSVENRRRQQQEGLSPRTGTTSENKIEEM
ncbi:hypothetical protein JCM5353_004262 [Sporobolomyces roseus]